LELVGAQGAIPNALRAQGPRAARRSRMPDMSGSVRLGFDCQWAQDRGVSRSLINVRCKSADQALICIV